MGPLGGAERRPVRGGQQAQHAVPEHPRAQEQEGRAPVLGRLSRQALSLSNKGYRFRGNSADRLVGRKSGRRWITRVRIKQRKPRTLNVKFNSCFSHLVRCAANTRGLVPWSSRSII